MATDTNGNEIIGYDDVPVSERDKSGEVPLPGIDVPKHNYFTANKGAPGILSKTVRILKSSGTETFDVTPYSTFQPRRVSFVGVVSKGSFKSMCTGSATITDDSPANLGVCAAISINQPTVIPLGGGTCDAGAASASQGKLAFDADTLFAELRIADWNPGANASSEFRIRLTWADAAGGWAVDGYLTMFSN